MSLLMSLLHLNKQTILTTLFVFKGGESINTIPSELWAKFDMRIRPTPELNVSDIEAMLNEILEDAGPGVSYEFYQKSLDFTETALDESNVWWNALKDTYEQM